VEGAGVEFEVGDVVIAVNMADRDTLLAEVGRRLGAGEGFALATLNLDHLVKLKRDAGFRAAYQAQDLVTADGNPIVWLSRVAGQDVALVPGSDMVEPLCRVAAEAGVGVAMVGGRDEVLALAAERLEARVPGLRIVCRIAPPMGFDPAGAAADAVLREVAASGAGLCFLALGAPKQEVLAARGRVIAPHVGFAGVGAGIDFVAGAQLRAPDWVRAIAMEWLWRAGSDPKRLAGRYLRAGMAFPALWLQARRKRG
jgi:N-acetylglucosaminyldiphosphoundecaprenol N-acetyl-beta-D-mannosaminyltransferase